MHILGTQLRYMRYMHYCPAVGREIAGVSCMRVALVWCAISTANTPYPGGDRRAFDCACEPFVASAVLSERKAPNHPDRPLRKKRNMRDKLNEKTTPSHAELLSFFAFIISIHNQPHAAIQVGLLMLRSHFSFSCVSMMRTCNLGYLNYLSK